MKAWVWSSFDLLYICPQHQGEINVEKGLAPGQPQNSDTTDHFSLDSRKWECTIQVEW